MPGIIGYDTIGGSNAAVDSTWHNECLIGAGHQYTAVTGDSVTEVAVYGANSGTCEVGIYEFSGGVPTNRVGSAIVVTIGATAGWHTAAANIALTNGVTYVIAIRYWIADSWDSYFDEPGGTQTSVGPLPETLPATWSQTGGTTGFNNSFYATVSAPTFDAEQEGYRFRNDDGSETTATWRQNQDTADTVDLDTTLRLRTLIDFTGDPGSAVFGLEYKEDSEAASAWRQIGVGLPGSTPTVVGFGTAALSGSADPSCNLDQGSWTPAENDIVVLFASSTTVLTVAGATGWVNPLGGTTSVNSDAHGYAVAYHIVTAGEAGGSTTFTATGYLGAAETGNVIGVALRGVDPAAVVNAAGSNSNNVNTGTPDVLAALTGANQPTVSNCLVVRGICQDSTGSYTTPAGHTSVTSINTNQIHQVFTRDTATTAGVDVDATDITPDAGDEDCAITIAFSPVSGTPAIDVATSTNFADGDATTAQLTAPAGKTTSDFTAGVMVEADADSNAVDVTADFYTEIEWALLVQDPAADTEVYQFRVTIDGAPAGTLTVTPSLTVSAASGTVVDGAIGVVEVVGVSGTVEMGELEVLGAVGVVEFVGVSGSVGAAPTEPAGAIGVIEFVGVPGTVELGQLEVLGAIGVVEYVGVSGLISAFPIPSSVSGRKVLDQYGNVYLIKTMSSWGMASILNDTDRETALDGVVANGFNGVTVWMGGTDWAGNTGWHAYEDSEGRNFWSGTPWASALGPAWASVDHLVAEAASRGLVVWFSFCGGVDPAAPGPDWEAVTDTDMYDVGVEVATRYASAANVCWHIMLDTDHIPSSTRGQRIQALFEGINDTEGASARPVRWMEVNNGSTTNEQGWLGNGHFNANINCIYDYSGSSVEVFEAGYTEVTTVPAGDCEPPYDGSPHYGGNLGQQLRERSYGVFIEGGCLINYGQEDWWPFGAQGLFSEGLTWNQVPAHSHTVQQSYVWDLVDAYCTDATYAPVSTFVTTGEGSGDTKVAQGASDTAALAYFPSSRTVAVDTTILAGTGNVRLRWYDPTAGTFTTISASEPQQSGRSVTYPSAHGDGTNDWVLVVDTTDFLAIAGSVGVVEYVGVAGTVELGGIEVTGSVGVVEYVGVAGVVEVTEPGVQVDGAVGVYELVGVAGTVELAALDVDGSTGIIEFVGSPGSVAIGSDILGAIGVIEFVGVSGLVIIPTGTGLNICYEVGAPVFRPRAAGAPTFVERDAGVTFVQRDPDDPTFIDREASITFVHGSPGAPTLVCE